MLLLSYFSLMVSLSPEYVSTLTILAHCLTVAQNKYIHIRFLVVNLLLTVYKMETIQIKEEENLTNFIKNFVQQNLTKSANVCIAVEMVIL